MISENTAESGSTLNSGAKKPKNSEDYGDFSQPYENGHSGDSKNLKDDKSRDNSRDHSNSDR